MRAAFVRATVCARAMFVLGYTWVDAARARGQARLEQEYVSRRIATTRDAVRGLGDRDQTSHSLLVTHERLHGSRRQLHNTVGENTPPDERPLQSASRRLSGVKKHNRVLTERVIRNKTAEKVREGKGEGARARAQERDREGERSRA